MATQLKRDLGFYAVLTISLGAMVGSGIFVLPGLGYEIAGPSIALAYLIAGFVVLPAAFSKSEMATAMPQAGGTYLYIDRSMGPLIGTVAGIGVWFQLVFKSSFALVGLGAYFTLFETAVPQKPVALAIAVTLVVVNILGVKGSGRLQAIVVSAVMGTLVFFVAAGLPSIDTARYEPFFDDGVKGLLSAAGIVFVSYAGVTKIASVAEEVKRPTRNIPRGILTSMVTMMILYPALVFVMVGVTPPGELSGDETPMATAAEHFLPTGVTNAIIVIAILALVSMANAGLLASSRYPLAMARSRLLPRVLTGVNDRTSTPIPAIAVTGGLMVILIAVFPILELAKLASAFQLLVFSLINLAVIAFRESRVDWYRPTFTTPWYPWTQIAGILAALLLLSQMGVVAIVGAIVIIAGGVAWYQFYGSSRASRESAGLDALRLRAQERLLVDISTSLEGPGPASVVLAVREEISDQRLRDLIQLGNRIIRPDRVLEVLRIGPQGDTVTEVHNVITDEERIFQNRVAEVASDIGADQNIAYVAGRNWRRQILSYIEQQRIDLILAEEFDPGLWPRGFGADMQWLADHVGSDFVSLGNRYLGEIKQIAVLGAGSPADPVKIEMASRVAQAEGATIKFVHLLPAEAAGREVVAMREYHSRLAELLDVEAVSEVRRTRDLVPAIGRSVRTSDLVIIGAPRTRFRFVDELVDRISSSVDVPVLMVSSHHSAQRRPLSSRVLHRFLE